MCLFLKYPLIKQTFPTVTPIFKSLVTIFSLMQYYDRATPISIPFSYQLMLGNRFTQLPTASPIIIFRKLQLLREEIESEFPSRGTTASKLYISSFFFSQTAIQMSVASLYLAKEESTLHIIKHLSSLCFLKF